MGLARLGYIVLIALAIIGLVGFIVAKLTRRDRRAPALLILLVLALVGVGFWHLFLNSLKQTMGEAIEDGDYSAFNLANTEEDAQVHGRPKPKPDEMELKAVVAGRNARRTIRLFGWTEEEVLSPLPSHQQSPTRGE
ncbi:MAG TPA: hypothetical protein VM221_00740 [Armatimonadota bacterium]|nr:hypothetical protein [Armatimonadota bacterium]